RAKLVAERIRRAGEDSTLPPLSPVHLPNERHMSRFAFQLQFWTNRHHHITMILSTITPSSR
ncbi:MAG: hypothetical protein KAI47_06815, partial [Deltaproteobacteria bacterium]|nr:hypothetical protein [Deltaproteobacteria bacterium]